MSGMDVTAQPVARRREMGPGWLRVTGVVLYGAAVLALALILASWAGSARPGDSTLPGGSEERGFDQAVFEPVPEPGLAPH